MITSSLKAKANHFNNFFESPRASLEYVHTRGEMNSNEYEISFQFKSSLRCSQLFICVHMNSGKMKFKTVRISYQSF